MSSDGAFSEAARGGHPQSLPLPIVPKCSIAGLRITCIGHSSLLIQAAGTNLLIDPVWSERPSPFRFAGPRRHNAPAAALRDLPPIHAILVSHNHYDHMDLSTLKHLWETHRLRLLMPLGNDTILRASLKDVPVTVGDWWDNFELPGQICATVLPSHHWSSRGLRDQRMALKGGFFSRRLRAQSTAQATQLTETEPSFQRSAAVAVRLTWRYYQSGHTMQSAAGEQGVSSQAFLAGDCWE